MKKYAELWTEQGRNITSRPWQEYPRPTLKRDSFFSLNGYWDFAVTDKNKDPENYDRRILVPFAPETLLSGIHEVFGEDKTLCYRKTFSLPEDFLRTRTILHFGAADQTAEVFFNGTRLGSHTGGYFPFSFDVTQLLKPENTVTVRVTDELSRHIQPYGKQRRKRGGMWYTPVSGIWQTVWLESVPEEYIRSADIKTEGNRVSMVFDGVRTGTVSVVTPEGRLSIPFSDGCAEFEVADPQLWSPESPYLYRATVESGQDRIETYFAFRTLEIKTVGGFPRLCLNGKPYFFHGVLDQGYYSDGLFTPATPVLYRKDILKMKELGFNTLRKHIKVEPELFYYACDELGMIVFQDMVNNGKYSFFRDTALPTVGIKKLDDRRMHRNPQTRKAFTVAMEQTMQMTDKHPSVCYYTIFNEGWGQFDGQSMYRKAKSADSSRFTDTASGWFRGADSDVESIHIYFRPVVIPESDKPIVLSEFGGYSYKPEGHVFNEEKTYGYRFFSDRNEFMDELEKLYLEKIIPAKEKGLCAAIYTQLSDVEDETNGLLSYDRAVCKVDGERMRAIAERLKE